MQAAGKHTHSVILYSQRGTEVLQKVFEFSLEADTSILSITERSKRMARSLSMGRGSVGWLAATLNPSFTIRFIICAQHLMYIFLSSRSIIHRDCKYPRNTPINEAEPCDTCGGVGGVNFREVIATCSRCRTTREHVYCMRIHLFVVPEDWVCESCLSSNMVPSEAGGKEDMAGTMTLDSSNIVCHDNTHTAGPSSASQAYSKRKNSKVKFIPTEDVIKLSLSTPKKGTSVRSNSGLKPGPSMALAGNTQVGSRAATSKSSTLRVNANPCLGPSRLLKPPRRGGVHSRINQQAPQATKKLEEPKAPVTFTKEYGRNEHLVAALPAKVNETFRTNVEKITNKASCASSTSKKCVPVIGTGKRALVAASEELVLQKPLMDALVPAKEVETPNTKIQRITKKACTPSPSRRSTPVASSEKMSLVALEDFFGREPIDPPIVKEHETSTMKIEDVMNKASCSFSRPMHTSPTVSSDGDFRDVAECKNSDVEERDLLNILPKFKLYRDYLPALHAAWKGGFLFNATPCKFYGGFQAQPPCTINRKTFEFSKRMPPVLQVKFIPRGQIWADLFQNNCPNLSDIALYFFPADNIESSKENVACLFELMEVHNSMMRSCIGGVELLIFTSKQLHLGSQKYFWGVFHPIKNNKTLDEVDKEHTPPIVPLECGTNDHRGMDNSEEVSMEIDMVGGENVGRVDMVVSRDASRRLCGIHLQSSTEKKYFNEKAQTETVESWQW